VNILNRLNPDKLSVEYQPGVTPTAPIIPRRYTLTHSDETAELFLTIGPDFDYSKIGPMRDEVLGEWLYEDGQYVFYSRVYVNGEFGRIAAGKRNEVFIRELPLALEAIRYGDREFFKAHPILDKSKIDIYFKSSYPKYDRVEYWGKFEEYLLEQ